MESRPDNGRSSPGPGGGGSGGKIEDPLLMQYAGAKTIGIGDDDAYDEEEKSSDYDADVEEHIIIFSEDDDDDASSYNKYEHEKEFEMQSLASTVVSAETLKENDDDDDDDNDAVRIDGFPIKKKVIDDEEDEEDEEQSVILNGIGGYVERFCTACEAKRCDLGVVGAFRGFCNAGMGNCAEFDDIIDDEIQTELESLKKTQQKKKQKEQENQQQKQQQQQQQQQKMQKTNLLHSTNQQTGVEDINLVSSSKEKHDSKSSDPTSTGDEEDAAAAPTTIAATTTTTSAESITKYKTSEELMLEQQQQKQQHQPLQPVEHVRTNDDTGSKYSQEVQDILEDLSRVATAKSSTGLAAVNSNSKDAKMNDSVVSSAVQKHSNGNNDEVLEDADVSSLVKMMLEVKKKDNDFNGANDGPGSLDRELSGLLPHNKPIIQDDDYESVGTVEVSLLPKLKTTVVVTTARERSSLDTTTGCEAFLNQNQGSSSSQDHDHVSSSLSKFSATFKSFVDSSFKKKKKQDQEAKIDEQKQQLQLLSSRFGHNDDVGGSGSVTIDADAFDVSTAKLHANTVRDSLRSSRGRLLSFGSSFVLRQKDQADVQKAIKQSNLPETTAGGKGTSSTKEEDSTTSYNKNVENSAVTMSKQNNFDSLTKSDNTQSTDEENADVEDRSFDEGFEVDNNGSGNLNDVQITESSMKSTESDFKNDESSMTNVAKKDIDIPTKQGDVVVVAETEAEMEKTEGRMAGAKVLMPVDPPGDVYDGRMTIDQQLQDEDGIVPSDGEEKESSLEVIASNQLLSELSNEKKKKKKRKNRKLKVRKFVKKAFSRTKKSPSMR